jgi:hypothetical protein
MIYNRKYNNNDNYEQYRISGNFTGEYLYGLLAQLLFLRFARLFER